MQCIQVRNGAHSQSVGIWNLLLLLPPRRANSYRSKKGKEASAEHASCVSIDVSSPHCLQLQKAPEVEKEQPITFDFNSVRMQRIECALRFK